jgi:hypothetical protein
MKTLALALASIAMAAGVARADDEPSSDESPAINMLGFRIGLGQQPLAGTQMSVMSIGLSLEHPVFRPVRVFGEYELVWVGRADDRTMPAAVEQYGDGHRIHTGLRASLVAKRIGGVRLFVDGELGGGFALISDNLTGVHAMPHLLFGVRAGYDLYARNSPSRRFEAEILVRGIETADGVGAMFGVGMLWGN